MKIQTLAIAAACLALGTVPGFAVSLNLGGAASVSLGGDSGVSVGVGADASTDSSGISLNANLGLDGAADTDTITGDGAATGSANVSVADTLSSDDELGRVVRLIETSDWNASSFANIDGVANGTTYDISGMVNADNQGALDLALSANADEIGELQAALAANASLNSWLEAQGTEASEVIALGVAADGSLAVFTN
jgi:hypothetical protein